MKTIIPCFAYSIYKGVTTLIVWFLTLFLAPGGNNIQNIVLIAQYPAFKPGKFYLKDVQAAPPMAMLLIPGGTRRLKQTAATITGGPAALKAFYDASVIRNVQLRGFALRVTKLNIAEKRPEPCPARLTAA